MEEQVKKTRKKEVVGIEKTKVEAYHVVAVEVAPVVQTNSVTGRSETIRDAEIQIITGAAWNIQFNGEQDPRDSLYSTTDWKFIAAAETIEELQDLLK